jgi:hypothetical protein
MTVNKILKMLLFLLIANNGFSANRMLDVYGVGDQTANTIIEQCGKEIEKYVAMESTIGAATTDELDNVIAKHMALRDSIVEKINSYGKFKFVAISPVYYPNINTTYTTIDIISSSQMFRMLQSPHRKVNNKLTLSKKAQNLLELWSTYNEYNINLINKRMFNSKEKSCPAVHCLWGFNKEELTRFFPKFREFANGSNAELKNIIQHSPDEEQRGAAIFILGHSDDYQSTAKFLFDYTNDQSVLVRNNSMRVIAEIVSTHKIKKIPLHNMLVALNYPLVTDRNKAASILYNVASHDRITHKQIIAEAGDTLIKLLKLRQPNNHDVAYRILKIISRKDYDEHDYQSWAKWIKDQH